MNIIELGFDIEKFDAQKKQVYNDLMEIYEVSKKIEGTKIQPGSTNGWSELKSQVAALKDQVTQLQEANLRYQQTQQKTTQGNNENTESAKEVTSAMKLQERGVAGLLAQQAQNQLDTQKLIQQRKDLQSQLKSNTITEAEYKVGLAAVNQQLTAVKVGAKDVDTALLNLEKVAQSGEGALNGMRAELVLMQIAFARMTDAEKSSDVGKELSANAEKLSNDINQQQQKVGDYTKNIGRYAESLSPLFENVRREISRLKAEQESIQTGPSNGSPESTARSETLARSIKDLENVIQVSYNPNMNYAKSISSIQKSFVDLSASGNQSQEFLEQFSKDINVVKADYKSLNAEVSKKPNTSNYTGSIDILKNALVEAKQNVDRLTQAEKLNTQEGIHAQQEVKLLTDLVGQQSIGFSSLAREVLSTGKALETMAQSGLQGTESFEKLQQEYANAQRKLHDFRNEQKILTDSVPKLAALTAAAKGLGGIYAAGAGAAALFAGENEKVEKELNKLVAVMTLLQGLNELHELFEQKNAIATALFGSATAKTTVALEGEAVAAEEAAVATGVFGRALAFVAANPIILVVAALTAALVYLISTFEGEEYQMKKNAEAIKDYSDAVRDETGTIEEQNKLLTKNLDLQKKKYENDLAIKQASGTNAETELAYKIKIAEVDQKITDQQIKSHPQINEDLIKETNNLAVLLEKQKTLDATVKQLTKDKLDGIKKVKLEGAQEDVEDVFGLQSTSDIKVAISNAKSIQKINKEAIESTKSSVEELTKIKDAKDASDQKQKELQAEKDRLDAEGVRKIALATAKIESDAVQDKNNLILANEHSTFEQRIKAMQSNQQALKNIAEAESFDVFNNPSSSDVDRTIAIKQYNATVAQITRDGHAQIEKETEDYNKRQLTAVYTTIKERVDAESQAALSASSDVSKYADDRLAAYAIYLQKQTELIASDAEFQKKTKDLTDKEIIQLDEETKLKLLELAQKSKDDISSIIVSAGAQELALQSSYAKKILAIEELGLSGRTGEAKKKAAKQLADDTFQSNRDQLEDAIHRDQDILDSQKTTDEAKVAAQVDLNNTMAALYKLDADHANQQEAEKLAKIKEIHALEKQLAQESIDFIGSLVDGGYDRQKDGLQGLIDQTNAYSDAETERINNSTLSEEEKEARLKELQESTATRNKQLSDQQKDIDIKKARFDKAVSISKIIQGTAVAIAEHLGNPFQIALIAAVGAVQLAKVLTQPIPQYAEGTDGHPGGAAVVGEGRHRELVKPKGGRAFIADRPMLLNDLPAGSQVIPLTAEAINDAMYGSWVEDMSVRHAIVTAVETGQANAWKIAQWQTEEMKKALEASNKKQPIRITNKIDFNWHLYVDKYIHGR